jgi:hypothetical protein
MPCRFMAGLKVGLGCNLHVWSVQLPLMHKSGAAISSAVITTGSRMKYAVMNKAYTSLPFLDKFDSF